MLTPSSQSSLLAICCFVSLMFQVQSCLTSSDCSESYYHGVWQCCDYSCVKGTSCVGQYCILQSDCTSSETCCSNKCVPGAASCLGRSCLTSIDCNDNENCCYGSCSVPSDCTHITYVIVGCVFGSIALFLGLTLMIVRCRQRRLRDVPLLGTRPTVYLQPQVYSFPSAPPVYPGQVPSQTYSPRSPTPYSAQPPPYKEETKGISGEVALEKNYGALN